VKKYFVEPFESAGIPTFPVLLILLLLLLLLLIYFLWPRGPPSLEVTVYGNGDLVEGALVKIAALDGSYKAEGETDAKGKAKLANLRKGEAVLEVIHDDYEYYNDSITIRGNDKYRADLEFAPVEKIDFEISVSSPEGAIPGAKVEIAYSKNKKTLSTDSNGKVSLALPKDIDLTATASKTGYQSAGKTTKSSEGRMSIVLQKEGSVGDGGKEDNPAEKDGILTIRTVDDANKPIKASVDIFNSRVAGSPLKSLTTGTDGKAEVPDFKVGTPLKLVASWTGYQDAKLVLTLKEKSEALLILKKGGVDKKETEITVADAKTRKAIEGAEISVYNGDNELQGKIKTAADGKAAISLIAGSYYANAEAEGYEYAKSSLRAGDKKTIYLRMLESNEKKIKLTVKTSDEDGKKYSRTSINFYDSSGGFVPPATIYSASNGEATTDILPGTYYLKAVKDSLYGSGQITILNGTANFEISITMYFPRGYLKVDAKEIKTQQPVSSFMATVTDSVTKQDVASKQCTGNCTFWIRAYRKYSVGGFSPQYGEAKFDATVTQVDQNSNSPGETLPDGTKVNSTFLYPRTLWFSGNGSDANPSASASPGANPLSMAIVFEGLYQVGNEAQPVISVRKGRQYIARMAVDFGTADKKGLYFRVGNTFSGSNDPGLIENLAYGGGEAPQRAQGSAAYDSACSLPIFSDYSNIAARYAYSEYGFSGVGSLGYVISVSDAIASSNFMLFYQIRGTDDAGSVVSVLPGATQMESCAPDAQCNLKSYPIENCGTLNTACCDDGCNSGLYCDSGSICRDIGTKPPNPFECSSFNISMSLATSPLPSCDRIVFKVDSIFPADAIPLKVFSSSGSETDNFNLKFKDKKNPTLNVDECFYWQASFTTGGKAIRYWPKGNCPYKPFGNSVPAAEFTMEITDIITQKTREIDVKVENETTMPMGVSLNAIDASYIPYKSDPAVSLMVPKSRYYKDADDPSLIPVYFLNNRQLEAENDDLYAGVYSGGRFQSIFTDTALSKNNNKGFAKLIGWDLGDWATRVGAGVPMQLHLSSSKESSILEIPASQNTQGLLFAISALASARVGGVTPTTAGSAYPEERLLQFIADKAAPAIARSVWRRSFNNTLTPVGSASDLEKYSPYKYFVSDPAANPPKFSMVMPERADTVYNIYLKGTSGWPVQADPAITQTQDHCTVRGGIYKLSVTASWKDYSSPAFSKFTIEPLKVSYTSNTNDCPQVFACNLITGKQKSPSGRYCYEFETPIVSDGSQSGIPDMRPFSDISNSGSPLSPSTYYLTGSQDTDLEGTSINYMDADGNFAELAPYHISAYPNVFTAVPNSGGGTCPADQLIAQKCTCEGQIQDPAEYSGPIYCCNDVVQGDVCTAFTDVCAIGPVPASGCECPEGDLVYSGYCCNTGSSLAPSQNACIPVCSLENGNVGSGSPGASELGLILSDCWCDGTLYTAYSGYCCDGFFFPGSCPIQFEIISSSVAETHTQTNAIITWATTMASVNNI
ncbi:MAG: carboxypeptidase regulatory-like domain-containing protein, partial [Candidatus Micrarchaeota archaeon]